MMQPNQAGKCIQRTVQQVLCSLMEWQADSRHSTVWDGATLTSAARPQPPDRGWQADKKTAGGALRRMGWETLLT
jgi:hypothetical protein